MFSRKEQILKKTGDKGIGRFEYLGLLVQEFHRSVSEDSQRQVLANLANFAYDPINFEFLRRLDVITIFLSLLASDDEELMQFSLAGLLNLIPDPLNAEEIVRKNGIFLISELLLHKNIEVSLNALTSLIFLINPQTEASIITPTIINKVLHYQNSPNTRLKNLGCIFLEDYCRREQIDEAKQLNLQTVDIPLPQ